MPKRPRTPAPVAVEDDSSDVELEETAAELVASGAVTVPQRVAVVNIAGLQQALSELVDPDLPWIERLEVVAAEDLPPIAADDDLKLELAFYGQALAAVAAARAELERLGIPHRRPDDYFAEMMKSDAHMQKVKDKLILESKRIAVVDTRRKDKAAAKFGKKVAAEKVAERAGEKRKHLDALKQWRTKKDVGASSGGHPGSSGGASAASANARAAEVEGLLSDKPFHSGSRAAQGGGRAGPGGGKGTQRSKDKKFGFGGRKASRKDNTAKSSASLKEFSVSRNKSLPPGMAGRPSGGPKARKGGERQGQRARQSARSHSAAKGGARR